MAASKASRGLTARHWLGVLVASLALSVVPSGCSPDASSGRCSKTDDCDRNTGEACIDGACTSVCLTHEHCGATGACTGEATDAEGNSVGLCEADNKPRGSGQFGSRCESPADCDEASGFACIGVGEGDLSAYCTKRNCEKNSECAPGQRCARRRASRRACADTCPGLTAHPEEDDCVPPSEIGSGKAYECGPVSLTFGLCERRSFCDACQSDADCRGLPNQICAKDKSGGKICTVLCDPDLAGCPWGSATNCRVWDEAVGKPTCSHRSGSCDGDGGSCAPCRDESDCPGGLCLQSEFTGERYCVDLSDTCSCEDGATGVCSGGGCPRTDSGLTMTCYGGSAFEGSPLRNTCVGADTLPGSSGESPGCWPAR